MATHTQVREFVASGLPSLLGLSARVAEKFGISRQAAHTHISRLVKEGVLEAEGNTRNRLYRLPVRQLAAFTCPITPEWPEDRVWRERIANALSHLPANVLGIWQYGFTEMFNNAIDHSAGSEVFVALNSKGSRTSLLLQDNGEGIFRKISRELRLPDEYSSILELAKGKLTTDPKHHTGEGIFFTSRVFDHFSIASGDLYFSHNAHRQRDMISDTSVPEPGTVVSMEMGDRSATVLKDVFDNFASADGNHEFSKTIVALDLARHEGEELVSRSQAKRLVTRFERFREVVLDFERIKSVGQAFADEVFRVFAIDHPGTKLIPIRMNEEVTRMVSRAQTAAIEARLQSQETPKQQ